MDDLFDEWEGIDWGSTPSVDTGVDLSGFDWGNVDFGLGNLDFGGIDLSGLQDFGFDLSSLGSLDIGNIDLNAINGIDTEGLFSLTSGALSPEETTSLIGGAEIPADMDLNRLYQDLEDTGTLLNVEQPTEAVKNYLLEGTKTPGLGFQGDTRALYQAETEEAPTFLTQGLKEPEVPGLSQMGGGQGLYTEIPTQYDGQGNKIPNTGGYVSQLGFIPYEATPVLGDAKSFINDPRLLGKPVFSTDQISFPSGTKTYVDSLTGKTITTSSKEKTGIEKLVEDAKKIFSGGKEGKEALKDNAMLMALLGGLMGLLSKGSAPKGPVGYQGGIPKYTAKRVPGRGVEYTRAAQGGLMGLKQGQYLDGATDGMADKIQTSIEGKQPARLSHGEFVIPADVVSHLGNGNSDAGADVLYEMMAKVRKARTGTPKQGKQINPRKMIPA